MMKAIINDSREIEISKFVLEVTEGDLGTRVAGMIFSKYSMDVIGLDDATKKEIEDLGSFDLYINKAPLLKLKASINSIDNATVSGSCKIRS